ncbi:methionyl-tRNA formyltransferase [Bacteroides pyogenes JCM 6292]|uniref:Methionyl-tRNA formyltransferase n=1 Tax=Bacteroides pyogenes JCM 6292 TaxID=1235809 RepID=W4P8N0_9BACE|nr:methionyl-tRNA formyltransferase [Bacteroides pyogenes JCM 6292]
MEKKDLRIVYMGTPDFAVESLRQLVEGGYKVAGVITMPDKPPDGDIRYSILR